jgi:hypothetical protein
MNWITENWQIIVALVIGIYEVVARLIPTVSDITILGKIIALLKWISDSVNNTKKK